MADAELIEAFVQKWRGVSGPQVAIQAAGITQRDVSRWRGKERPKQLTDPKRAAILADLRRTPEVERAEKRLVAAWLGRIAAQLTEEAKAPASGVGAAEGLEEGASPPRRTGRQKRG